VFRLVRVVLLAAAMLLLPAVLHPAGHAAATAPPDTSAAGPVATNDLLPQDNDLGNCVGTVERANCGSDARADGHTYLVFGVLTLALVFIGWRISRAVRAREQVNQPPDGDRTTVAR
jgi:hypothetical protein